MNMSILRALTHLSHLKLLSEELKKKRRRWQRKMNMEAALLHLLMDSFSSLPAYLWEPVPSGQCQWSSNVPFHFLLVANETGWNGISHWNTVHWPIQTLLWNMLRNSKQVQMREMRWRFKMSCIKQRIVLVLIWSHRLTNFYIHYANVIPMCVDK